MSTRQHTNDDEEATNASYNKPDDFSRVLVATLSVRRRDIFSLKPARLTLPRKGFIKLRDLRVLPLSFAQV